MVTIDFSAFAKLPIPVLVVSTPETTAVYINEQFTLYTGYSASDIEGKPLVELPFTVQGKPIRLDEAFSCTLSVVCSNSTQQDFFCFSNIFTEQNSDFSILTLTPYKNREETELLLHESEAKYRSVINHSPYAIFINLNGKIIMANTKCVSLFGFSSEQELLGQSPFAFFRKDFIPVIQMRLEKLRRNEPVPDVEDQLICNDGTVIPCLISSSAFYLEGKMAVHVILQDLREKKLQQQLLQHSEEKFRNIVESSHDLIWSVDAQGIITYINPAVHSMYGYMPEELLGKTFREFIPEDQRNVDRATFSEAMKTSNTILKYKSIFVHKNGSIVHTLSNVTILRSPDGSITGSSGTTKDITDLVSAEARLLEQQHRLQVAQNIAKLGYWEFHPKHNIFYWSDLMYTIHEVSETTFFPDSDSVFSLIHPEDAENCRAGVKLAVTNKQVFESEYRIITPSGRIKYVQVKAELQLGKLPDHDILSGTLLDISERKMYLNEITDLYNRISLAVKTAKLGIWSYRVKTGRYIRNDILPEIYGIAPDQFPMNPDGLLQYVHPEDLGYLRSKLQEAYRGALVLDVQFRIITPAGNTVYINSSANPLLDEKGEIYKVIGIQYDITEFKLNEIELKDLSEKLRMLFADLDMQRETERKSLATELHDELGQVLTSIGMNISLLSGKLKNNTYNSEYLLKELEDMKQILDGAKVNIKDLIKRLRPEYLDNLGLIPAIRYLVKEYSKRTGIAVEFNCNNEEPALSPTKENTIYRVVQEGLTNIAKHSHASLASIDFISTNSIIEISIRDNGKGFVPKISSAVSGFGLIGIRERLAALNIIVHFRSEPGKGTVISFRVEED